LRGNTVFKLAAEDFFSSGQMSKLAAAARLARRSVVEQPISPDRKDVFSSAELEF